MQKLCRLLAQVPSLEITGFIPYPSNLLQNPSKPHPANTATLWGTHLLNLLRHLKNWCSQFLNVLKVGNPKR